MLFHIYLEIQEDGPIKISRALKELNSKIAVVQHEYMRKKGKEIGIEELAKELRRFKRRYCYGT